MDRIERQMKIKFLNFVIYPVHPVYPVIFSCLLSLLLSLW